MAFPFRQISSQISLLRRSGTGGTGARAGDDDLDRRRPKREPAGLASAARDRAARASRRVHLQDRVAPKAPPRRRRRRGGGADRGGVGGDSSEQLAHRGAAAAQRRCAVELPAELYGASARDRRRVRGDAGGEPGPGGARRRRESDRERERGSGRRRAQLEIERPDRGRRGRRRRRRRSRARRELARGDPAPRRRERGGECPHLGRHAGDFAAAL
jgi:hypothetical protein